MEKQLFLIAINQNKPSISINKSESISKLSRYEFVSKPRWKTSRNNAFPSNKDIKPNWSDDEHLKKIQSAMGLKASTYKASQVKIYLKTDE